MYEETPNSHWTTHNVVVLIDLLNKVTYNTNRIIEVTTYIYDEDDNFTSCSRSLSREIFFEIIDNLSLTK